MVGWFERAPCIIEDFIFADASTTFRCLRARPTIESPVMSFSANVYVMNESISLVIADFIPDILYFISCKLFSSRESTDTPCTIIVLERASCSTRSILTSGFCTVALLGTIIELFLGHVMNQGASLVAM